MADMTYRYSWALCPSLRDAGTPYDLLGVARDAPHDAVKRAAGRAYKIAHPDKGGTQEQFSLVYLAYRVLSTLTSRQLYDTSGEFYDSGPGAHEQQAPPMAVTPHRDPDPPLSPNHHPFLFLPPRPLLPSSATPSTSAPLSSALLFTPTSPAPPLSPPPPLASPPPPPLPLPLPL
jgi:curved DNA-binding protein CbpA